jgi:4-hydroxy-tetrahydrodipicolinate synthase
VKESSPDTKPGFATVFAAVPTPFTPDQQQIDRDALREIVRFNLKNNVRGILACGGTGEFPNLSMEERKIVMETVVDEAKGRATVLATTGYPDTKRTIEMTRIARSVGVDVAMIPKPYGGTIPTESGMVEHFQLISKAVEIPLCAYVAPITSLLDTVGLLWQGQSGIISTGFFRKICEIKNVAAFKDTSCNMFLLQEVIKAVGDKIAVMAGTDRVTLPSLLVGCTGSITASACVAPKQHIEMFEAVKRGDLKKANEIHYKLLSLYTAIELLPNFPAAVKTALELQGLRAGPVRSPCQQLTEVETHQLKEAMTEAGLV